MVVFKKLYRAYFVHGPLNASITEEMYVRSIAEEIGMNPTEPDWDNEEFERRANLVFKKTDYGEMNRNYFPRYDELGDLCEACPASLPIDSWDSVLTRYYQWWVTGKPGDGSLCEVFKISNTKYRYSKDTDIEQTIERRIYVCGDYCTIVEFHPHDFSRN